MTLLLADTLLSCTVIQFAELDYLLSGDGSTSQMPWSLQKLQVTLSL